MTSPINKIARKRAENLLRDMFVRGTLRGMEKPMSVWAMESMFTDNYDKGSSAWRNMYNRVKRDFCRSKCKLAHYCTLTAIPGRNH